MISHASMRRALRRWLYISLGLIVFFVWLINHWVINNTYSYVYTNWSLLPENNVGLVLGTSPYTSDGGMNPQFQGRVQAAAQLYQLGKVKHLLVSGANPSTKYNEPRAMWRALIKLGVPESAITMDFAGFRTFDSVARAKLVFSIHRVTVITQRYHAYRAVFIGKKLGMDICAYVAPGGQDLGLLSWTRVREWLARVKAVLDIYVLDTAPRFTGPPETIQVGSPGSSAEPPSSGGGAAPSSTSSVAGSF